MDSNAFRSWKNELVKISQIEGLLVPGQEKALLVIASKLAPRSTIVEIGSFKGRSTACLALGSPSSVKIYTIDTFAGNSKDFSEGVQFMGHDFLEEFTENIKKTGAMTKVFPTIGFSSEIGKAWKKPIDLLFIDGSHIYEDVKTDFELFFPWVKDGGFVLFHDVDEQFPGVLRVWNKLAKNELEYYSKVSSLFFGIKKGGKISRKSAVNIIDRIIEEIITPKVYVVIPVFNRIDFTKKCFSSLAKQTYKNFEVILVDDGSKDRTSAYISKKYPKCKIIKSNGKWWWTRSMHEGVKEVLKTAEDEDFILSMNNDCYFKKDYLKNIVKASSENQRAITGSIIIEAEHPTRVMGAGVLINWENAMICDVTSRFSDNLKFYSDRGLIKDLDTLPGKGTLIPKEVFNKIGNFNYLMLPHYIGDYEFFCRAKRKNFKLMVSSKAQLYNFAKQTGISHINTHSASYKEVVSVLFSRKSKLNIIDHLNFLLLCCPIKYLPRNLREVFNKLASYSMMLFPLYYIKISKELYNQSKQKTKLFLHNLPIYFKQNSTVSKTKLLFHNIPFYIKQSPTVYKIKILFHNVPIYAKQNSLLLRIRLLIHNVPIHQRHNKLYKKNTLPVSYGYSLSSKKEAVSLNKAWLKRELPKRQMEIVTPLLDKRMIPDIAKPVIKILKRLKKNLNILDVGCSSGYYYDFFKYSRLDVKYQGCDFSPHFISLAKKLHPDIKFKIGNITKLPYKDNEFDIVLASGILEYEINYKKALAELARVSSHYVIIHRIPLFDSNSGTKFFKKIGYGVIMTEMIFDQKELSRIFKANNLNIKKISKNYPIDLKIDGIQRAHQTTIFLQKLNPMYK